MSRLPLFLVLIVAVGGGVWFLARDDQPLSPEHAPPSVTHAPAVEEMPEPSPPDLVSAKAREVARTSVQIEQTKPVAEDPCASVRAELDAAIVVSNEHEKTIAQLNRKLAAALRELGRLKYDETTPYGAFLASYEADEINAPYLLYAIEDWLREFPVFLLPGEATWIVERTAADDWGLYGQSCQEAVILFLGPDRLVAELPETRLAELRAEWAEEAYFD